MKRFAPVAFAALFGLGGLACTNTPTPLAPSLRGSVGVPHNGVLTEGAELPKAGPGYLRYRQHSPVYFGLPRLVRAIERAAARVEAELPGGAPLVVGDLSAETGGKISRHNSHRTGRDVDFLFYIESPSGIPLKNPGFLPLAADGLVPLPGGQYGVLDVERQWLLFKTLLTDPEIDIQFLFMSRALEARVIDYALAKETDLALIWKAQTVMLQPGDSLPHADHVHVRIACKPEETVHGCSGGGPHWSWLEPFPRLERDLAALLEDIREGDPFDLAPLPAEESENSTADARPEAGAHANSES